MPSALAGKMDLAIDANRTWVAESRHMVHLVLVAPVDGRSSNAAGKAELKRLASANIRSRTCRMLKASGKVFGYVKKPGGFIENEIVDVRGRRLAFIKVSWASCK